MDILFFEATYQRAVMIVVCMLYAKTSIYLALQNQYIAEFIEKSKYCIGLAMNQFVGTDSFFSFICRPLFNHE